MIVKTVKGEEKKVNLGLGALGNFLATMEPETLKDLKGPKMFGFIEDLAMFALPGVDIYEDLDNETRENLFVAAINSIQNNMGFFSRIAGAQAAKPAPAAAKKAKA